VRQYDAAGRVNALIALGTGEPQVVHYVVQFQPFGPPAGAIYGNGQPRIDVFDLDGRRYAYSRDGAYRVIGYDAASRIPYIYPDTVPAQGDQYSYDDLDRLTQWISPTTTQGYAYDLSGDRTQRSIGANPYNYTYPAGSHRLASTSGPSPAQTNQYDGAGNLIDDGTRHFTYDARGRLIQASQGTIVASYVVNAFGQRVQKAVSGGATPTQTHFVYDEAGHLLGEYDALSGLPIQEYVWYDDTLVGILRGSPASFAVYSVETDHLGTPRQVRDVNRQLRWQWDSDPFGSTLPNANPAGLGNFTLNLRFPGQYYDEESGLHYNYLRDYDPTTGRYIQSDPIGLDGGINTYLYVGGNPISRIDPTGLIEHSSGQWKDCGKGCRIRIDTTIVNGQVKRHLHWECRNDSGECGENGEKSHGGSWEDAPENIKECARRHGFQGDSVAAPQQNPTAPMSQADPLGQDSRNPSRPTAARPWWAPLLVIPVLILWQ